MIAALFVETNGTYFGIAGVDPWDSTRDARNYGGPHPVVAHPPCARWGRYWHGSPSSPGKHRLGDDAGCFAAALAAVKAYGGVIEHPAASRAWRHFGLNEPTQCGAWSNADFEGGWTCQVDQGHFGHEAPKATWLLAYGTECPQIPHAKSGATGSIEMMCRKKRERTPPAFRDFLLAIARSADRR